MAREKKTTQNPFEENKAAFSKLGVYQKIDITKLEYNDGQLEGISKNPRYLKEAEHDTLKKSLVDSPELLEYKPLMVYPLENGNYITVCGNMRLRIANELHLDGHSEFDTIPCFILKQETPIQKIKEFAIKDNVQAGNWEVDELQGWGVDCSFLQHDEAENLDDFFEEIENGNAEKEKKIEIKVCIPKEEEDNKDAIKQLIQEALVEYPNIEIK